MVALNVPQSTAGSLCCSRSSSPHVHAIFLIASVFFVGQGEDRNTHAFIRTSVHRFEGLTALKTKALLLSLEVFLVRNCSSITPRLRTPTVDTSRSSSTLATDDYFETAERLTFETRCSRGSDITLFLRPQNPLPTLRLSNPGPCQ